MFTINYEFSLLEGVFVVALETAGCVKLGGGANCFCENISYSFILFSLLCGIAGEGDIMEKGQSESFFFFTANQCFLCTCTCVKK